MTILSRVPGFLRSRGVYLNIVALQLTASIGVKAVGYFQPATYLRLIDPVLGVTNRTSLALSGCAEALVLANILLAQNPLIANLGLLWLSAVFMAYKVLASVFGNSLECPCLGFLGESFGLQKTTVTWITWALLTFWLGPSLHRLSSQSLASARSIVAIER